MHTSSAIVLMRISASISGWLYFPRQAMTNNKEG
jgi:hypothetical protein